MARMKFQGVRNVISFNRHLYILAVVIIGLFSLSAFLFDLAALYVVAVLATLQTVISIAVSYYVYDRSGLYQLDWTKRLDLASHGSIVNVHAGFDETTEPLAHMFPDSEIVVLDFYDPRSHTERSIERAQNISNSGTPALKFHTSRIPAADASVDALFAIFTAHEIRAADERMAFFREVSRVIGSSGKAIVTEHLRDSPNLLAYGLGAFHFLSKSSWLSSFERSGLRVAGEFKITPFVTTFVLERDGITA